MTATSDHTRRSTRKMRAMPSNQPRRESPTNTPRCRSNCPPADLCAFTKARFGLAERSLMAAPLRMTLIQRRDALCSQTLRDSPTQPSILATSTPRMKKAKMILIVRRRLRSPVRRPFHSFIHRRVHALIWMISADHGLLLYAQMIASRP